MLWPGFSFVGQALGLRWPFAGNLYGTALALETAGFVYKLDPSGQETVLYTFSNPAV